MVFCLKNCTELPWEQKSYQAKCSGLNLQTFGGHSTNLFKQWKNFLLEITRGFENAPILVIKLLILKKKGWFFMFSSNNIALAIDFENFKSLNEH